MVRTLVREAYDTLHFSERLDDRIMNLDNITPPFDVKHVQNIVPFLKRVNFPKDAGVAVNVFRSGTVYRSTVKTKGEPSIFGNNLWVIVRDNHLITLFFRRDDNPPDDVRYRVFIEKLWDIVDKRGSYDITVQDLSSTAPKKADAPVRKRGPNLSFPVINIRGGKWYADQERELFIYVKNINKVMSFDDAFALLSEPELDDILSQLATPQLA